jgi:microcin C transport system permease protein
MILTLFGVLLLTFVVIQFVPGGLVEQYLAEARAAGWGLAEGGLVHWGAAWTVEQIKALYGFDEPARVA